MKFTTIILPVSVTLVGTLLGVPAAAQEASNVGVTTPATVPATSTTTTTSADTAGDPILGPSTPEPKARDTVTVSRSMTPNRPWLLTGGVILVGTYVPTAVIASTQGRTVEDGNLLIPVIGPWMNLADRRCDGCTGEGGNLAMVVGSGILQGVGAGMTLMSFFIPEKIAAATIEAGPVKLNVSPWQAGRSGLGVSTFGVF